MTLKREDFLSNSSNKTQLIQKLALLLVQYGQDVTHSTADADIDIVRVALKVCTQKYFIKHYSMFVGSGT